MLWCTDKLSECIIISIINIKVFMVIDETDSVVLFAINLSPLCDVGCTLLQLC